MIQSKISDSFPSSLIQQGKYKQQYNQFAEEYKKYLRNVLNKRYKSQYNMISICYSHMSVTELMDLFICMLFNDDHQGSGEIKDNEQKDKQGKISMGKKEGCDVGKKEWDGLKILDISNVQLGSQGMNQLTLIFKTYSKWPKLAKISANNCNIQTQSLIRFLQELSTNKASQELKSLSLSQNPIGDGGMKFVLHNFNHIAHQLNQLWLYKCQISCQSFKIGGPVDALSNLKVLNLNDNSIGRHGIAILSSLKMENIQLLFLQKNQLTNKCMKIICKSHWLKARRINLNLNPINQEGIQNLYLNNWKNILELLLWEKIQLRQMAVLSLLYWPMQSFSALGITNFYAKNKNCNQILSLKNKYQ